VIIKRITSSIIYIIFLFYIENIDL
jgi:hypothetical protein